MGWPRAGGGIAPGSGLGSALAGTRRASSRGRNGGRAVTGRRDTTGHGIGCERSIENAAQRRAPAAIVSLRNRIETAEQIGWQQHGNGNVGAHRSNVVTPPAWGNRDFTCARLRTFPNRTAHRCIEAHDSARGFGRCAPLVLSPALAIASVLVCIPTLGCRSVLIRSAVSSSRTSSPMRTLAPCQVDHRRALREFRAQRDLRARERTEDPADRARGCRCGSGRVTASMNRRLSAALTPDRPVRPGSKSLIRSHWSSRSIMRRAGIGPSPYPADLPLDAAIWTHPGSERESLPIPI